MRKRAQTLTNKKLPGRGDSKDILKALEEMPSAVARELVVRHGRGRYFLWLASACKRAKRFFMKLLVMKREIGQMRPADSLTLVF